jgi:hypothetical protein
MTTWYRSDPNSLTLDRRVLRLWHEPGKHARPEVDDVSSLVYTSMRQYAVISVRTLPYCERLVIAYPDEKTLRDLLAGPSIVALGYSSREEAEASIPYRTRAQPLRRNLMATLVASSTRALKEFVSNHPLATDKFRLGRRRALSVVFCSSLSWRLLLSSIRSMRCPRPFGL